jgi:hypothetical protein
MNECLSCLCFRHPRVSPEHLQGREEGRQLATIQYVHAEFSMRNGKASPQGCNDALRIRCSRPWRQIIHTCKHLIYHESFFSLLLQPLVRTKGKYIQSKGAHSDHTHNPARPASEINIHTYIHVSLPNAISKPNPDSIIINQIQCVVTHLTYQAPTRPPPQLKSNQKKRPPVCSTP